MSSFEPRGNCRRAAQFAVLFIMLAFAGLAHAQSTAAITGTVTDPQGAVVPNAKITLTNVEKGTVRTTQTDNTGNYQLPSLPVGKYDLVIEAPGLAKYESKDLVLQVARTQTIDAKLALPTAQQQVTVTTEAPMIEENTMTVGQVINQKTVQEIPLNGRHFVDLGLLIPGTVTPPQNGFLTAPLRGQGSFQINTAGNREDTVNFMINGVNLNDMVQNQITFQPSINTVQEFNVDNSTYSAMYGRNSGAIVNIATRSGSNDFHGEAFDFLRNNWLDARNYFNPVVSSTGVAIPQSAFKRNNFGGDIGGPILKNKLFFYASYEGLRQRQGLTINSPVLSDAQRAAVTDPTSQQLLNFIPHANGTSGATSTFQGSATAPVNINQWTGDVQYTISDKDSLHGYYAFQMDQRQEPTLQGDTIPGFGDTRASHRQILTLNETHIFNSDVVNEARLGFNRIHITFEPNNNTDPTTLGINGGTSGPIGLPFTQITGLGLNFGGPAGFPSGRGDATGVVSDTLSWLHGRHSLKFGGEFRRFSNNNFAGDTGTFVFNTLADFNIGQVDRFAVTPGTQPSRIYTGGLGFFAMDTIKLTRNVTLELGVRWDWNMSPTEAEGRFMVFDPTTSQLVASSPPYGQNTHNLQPRVGFAWDIFGSGRTVLRAGYGYMVDEPVTNLVTALASNPPFAVPLNFTGVTTWGNAINAGKSGGVSPATVDPNFKNAYVQNWNLNLQQQVTPNTSIMIGFFGSKGTDLRLRANINQFVNGVRPFPTVVSSPDFTCPSPLFPACPALTNINQQESVGNSNYQALWITGNRRLSHGLQFNASYTWSKSFDYNSLSSPSFLYQLPENAFNPRLDYGPSDFDARNRFVTNILWEVPLKGNKALTGWQLSTIFQVQSGNPIDIFTNGFTSLTGIANVRPDLIGTPQLIGSVNQWFTNSVCSAGPCAPGSVFFVPSNGNKFFGNMPRNYLVGPGFDNVDFSILKNTKLTERFTLQWRTDFFNLFNHPNFGQPGNAAGSGTFGVITNTRFPVGDAGSSRQIQLAAKLLF